MNKAQEEADKLRSEAKRHLNALLKIPEGYSSGITERFVDCLIGAAVLELAALQHDAHKGPNAEVSGAGTASAGLPG